MSEWLTDEELESWIKGSAIDAEKADPISLVDSRVLHALVTELRAHRASALTEEECEALGEIRAEIDERLADLEDEHPIGAMRTRALAVLDKLLAAPTRKEG